MNVGKVFRSFTIGFLFFVLGCLASAAPAPSKSSGSKHCLWRVTNAKAPVYLLGSIHILRKSDYPLPAVIDQAIQQSEQFYFEMAPDGFDDFHRRVEGAARLPRGVEIKDKVHAKTWDYLRTTARGGNFDWVHYKAWAIANYVLDYPMHEPFSIDLGVDNYVRKKARQRGRPMRGLESAADHAAVYTGMNEIESEGYLLRGIVYADKREAKIGEDIAAWRVGDTAKLAASEYPPLREAPGLDARFLEWRNTRWIPRIEDAIKSGKPTMIVAGAAHFSGPNSVLNMLRARGYQIEQL
jgi:hypothetical protein